MQNEWMWLNCWASNDEGVLHSGKNDAHHHSEWCRINQNTTSEKTKSRCTIERTYTYSILSEMRIGNKDLCCSFCLLSGVLPQRYLCLGKTGQIFYHIGTVLHKCLKYISNHQKRALPPPPKKCSNKQTKQNHNLHAKTRCEFGKRNVKSRSSYL